MNEQNKLPRNEKIIVDLQASDLKATMADGTEYPVNIKSQILQLLALDAAVQDRLDTCNYWMDEAARLQTDINSEAFKQATAMHDKEWDSFKIQITFDKLTVDIPLWLVDNYEALCQFIRVVIDNHLDNC